MAIIVTMDSASLWYVIDTEPPNAEAGEARVFATCDTKEAAVMTCMSLNGQQVQSQ